MFRRKFLLLYLAAAIVSAWVAYGPTGCSNAEREAIVVEGGRISVTNHSRETWSDVEVWLNAYYRAYTTRLLPGQRVDIPIRRFVASQGQFFDPAKAMPLGVEVRAKGARGEAIRHTWGKDWKR